MATSSTSASNLTDSYQNIEMPFSATNIIRSPVSALLEYMGHREAQGLINESVRDHLRTRVDNAAVTSNAEQVAITIVSAVEQQLDSSSSYFSVGQGRNTGGQNQISVPQVTDLVGRLTTSDSRPDRPVTDNADGMNEGIPHTSNSDVERDDAARVGGASNRDTLYHRHYIQQATRWIEALSSFSLLLLRHYHRKRFTMERMQHPSRFERERTCPLCRALVKPTDLVSFADGSTSLLFQLF